MSAPRVEAGSFNTVQLAGQRRHRRWRRLRLRSASTRLTSDGYDISPDQTAQWRSRRRRRRRRRATRKATQITTVYLRGGKALTPMLPRRRRRALSSHKDVRARRPGLQLPDRRPAPMTTPATTTHEQFLVGASATLEPDGRRVGDERLRLLCRRKRRSRRTGFPFLFGPPRRPRPATSPASRSTARRGRNAHASSALQSTSQFGDAGFVSFVTGFAESKKETYKDPFTRPRRESRTLNGVGLQYRAEIAEQLYLSATAAPRRQRRLPGRRHLQPRRVLGGPRTSARACTPRYGTGVTNPTFFEQFGFNPGIFIGNPDLVPEEADGWDIGVEQTLLDGRLVLDLTYFESTLENEIFTAFPAAGLPVDAAEPRRRNPTAPAGKLTLPRISDRRPSTSSAPTPASTPPNRPASKSAGPKDQASLDASWRVGGGPLQLNLGVTYNGEQIDTDFGTFLRTASIPTRWSASARPGRSTTRLEVYGRDREPDRRGLSGSHRLSWRAAGASSSACGSGTSASK